MDGPSPERRRRPRYQGHFPRRFEERYKEHALEQHPDLAQKLLAKGRTPAGGHIPVLLEETLAALRLSSGDRVVDGTLGHGGHALKIAEKIAPGGEILGLDIDEAQLQRTQRRLLDAGCPLAVLHSNFAGIDRALGKVGWGPVQAILVDLGVSSMQIDDPARGFSYKFDGPLDMRMDRRTPLTAADWLARLDARALAEILRENADEPAAEAIAQTIVSARARTPLLRTRQLTEAVLLGLGIKEVPEGAPHPAARSFQALRIHVNQEFSALENFLRVAPQCLVSGGRLAVISFHSGEDRRVKQAFRAGLRSGVFAEVSELIRATPAERGKNPRSAPARLRWALRS